MAGEIFDEECVTHQLRSGAPPDARPRGPEAIKEHVAGWLVSFPDLHFDIEQMLSDGDRVATQLVMRATHTGAWLGIPPTGKAVEVRMFTVHRIRDQKIVEDWVLVESLGFFQQLGVLPDMARIIEGFVSRAS